MSCPVITFHVILPHLLCNYMKLYLFLSILVKKNFEKKCIEKRVKEENKYSIYLMLSLDLPSHAKIC